MSLLKWIRSCLKQRDQEWIEVTVPGEAEPVSPPAEKKVEPDIPVYNGKPTVSIDFDGVIHSYISGWHGADVIPDPPVSVAIQRSKRRYTSIDWLTDLVNHGEMNVAIFSSRNHQRGALEAMKAYLCSNGMSEEVLEKISFPTDKPPSLLLIDDRAVQFKGEFMSPTKILNFKPWKYRED